MNATEGLPSVGTRTMTGKRTDIVFGGDDVMIFVRRYQFENGKGGGRRCRGRGVRFVVMTP